MRTATRPLYRLLPTCLLIALIGTSALPLTPAAAQEVRAGQTSQSTGQSGHAAQLATEHSGHSAQVATGQQAPAQLVAERLVQQAGHLLLASRAAGDTTWVYYEDRRSVNPVAEALQLRRQYEELRAQQRTPQSAQPSDQQRTPQSVQPSDQQRTPQNAQPPRGDIHVVFVPTWRQEPTLGSDGRSAGPSGALQSTPSATERLRPRTTIDITLHPQVRWEIGFFEDYLRTNPRLAPEVAVRRGGFVASAQWVFPLDQELPEPNELYHREHHPGIIRAGYLARLGPRTFASLDAGLFTRNRYGYQASVRRYMGRTIVGLDLGLTGYYSFFRGDADYSELNIVTPLLDVIHQMPWYNVVARVRAGKFLAQSPDRLRLGEYLIDDWGVRVDVLRRFGSFEIGAFMRSNEAEYSTGITAIIPLAPGFSWGSGRASARVRPLSHFQWDFGRTRRGDFSRPERGGRLFQTGRDWDALDRLMSPIYWRMMEQLAL